MPAADSLDSFDRAILAAWQHDTARPAQQIGDEVGLSAAAVQRRLKRLRESGVIRAEVAHLDPAAVGLAATVIVHVDIDRETAAHVEAFKALVRERPEVQQCWYTTGANDFVLVVHVADLAAYERFTREVLEGHDNVARFTSHVALGEVKGGLALDLGRPGRAPPGAE